MEIFVYIWLVYAYSMILVFQAIWLVCYLGVIEHYSLPYNGVNNVLFKQNKMAGVNSKFATISEAEVLKIQDDAVPENTKKATKSVVEITEWVYTKAIILFNLGE